VNPWGILFVGIGLIMIIIGFKGSQHSVIDAFKGVKGGTGAQATKTSAPASVSLQDASAPQVNLQAAGGAGG
jgi:hypothetical protein